MTTSTAPPSPYDCSSYGEALFVGTDRFVSESAIKIINLGSVAIGFCGDLKAARDFIEELSSRLEIASPIEVLQQTIQSRSPLDPAAQFSLIIAISNERTPRLFAFNMNGDQALTEVSNGHLIQFGSLPSPYKSLIPQMVDQLLVRVPGVSDHKLVLAMSILQSLGVHDYLMAAGVGGAFCGIVADSAGIRWQKDLLTCIYGPELQIIGMVATVVRENVLVVRSTFNNRCTYFGDSLMGGISEAWKARWWDDAFDRVRAGRFDYVSFLGAAQRTITIAEMRRQLNSEFVRVIPPNAKSTDSEDFVVKVLTSPMVTSLMRLCPEQCQDGSVEIAVGWAPFEASKDAVGSDGA